MELFEAFVAEMVRWSDLAVRVELEDGQPVLVTGEHRLALVDGGLDLEKSHPLARFAPRLKHLRRIWEVCSVFPLQSAGGLTVTVSPPEWGIDHGGLRARVSVSGPGGQARSADLLLVSRYLLDEQNPTWQAVFGAWRERCGEVLGSGEIEPVQLVFELPGDEEQPDPGWETFAAGLDLGEASIAARVERGLAWADRQFPKVEARFREFYNLPLPRGLRDLAALIAALGALPRHPPGVEREGEPGWDRGSRWLDDGVSLSPGGLGEWFEPGGLERPTRDAREAYREGAPPGVEGPLDPRLDMRFRRDAPQFIPFAWGEHSDGHHWGFWYDSPVHRPRIASNWARDSAETWADEEADMLAFLLGAIEERDEQWEEGREDLTEYPYVLVRRRATQVVEMHVRALIALLERRAEPPEPSCPWPLSEANPIGSPRLALPPGSGQLNGRSIGFGDFRGQKTDKALRAAIASARKALQAGQPAHAYGLGLYLHWRDSDDLRQEAAELLRDAYLALGWEPFAEILALHVQHRDLPSVGVFQEEPWPPVPPTTEQIKAAPSAVAVAWDYLQSLPGEPALPDRKVAHDRAERLGLDWHDPVQRALATFATDEDKLRQLLPPLLPPLQ